MSAREITIHHFEDEQELMAWIPGVLLNSYWADHPEWVQEEANYQESEDGKTVSFELLPGVGVVTIKYRVYTSPDEFRHESELQDEDIVLFDLMTPTAEGNLKRIEVKAIDNALSRLGPDRVYVLTGYPLELPKSLEKKLGPDHLFVKPMDLSEFTRSIRSTVGIT